MTVAKKKRQYSLRMSKVERAQLQRLADHFGLSPSSLIRLLLKEREREIA